jgi:hypothetical protein
VTNVKIKISDFLRSKGEQAVLPALFLSGLVLHTWLCIYMETYAPVSAEFPFPEYRFMSSFVGALLTALIPVIAYKIAEYLEVGAIWKRLLAAIVCGLYPAVISHTKLAISESVSWNGGVSAPEVLAFLFPCVIALILVSSADIAPKSAALRHFTAILLAVTITAAVIAHERMLAAGAAAVLTAVFTRLVLKREPLPIRTFLLSLLVLAAVTLYLHHAGVILGNSYLPSRAIESYLSEIGIDLYRLIAGHLYYFAVSTWGLGILALCLLVKHTRAYTKRIKQDKYSNISAYSATSSAALETRKQAKFLILSMFSFLALLFSIGYSAIVSLSWFSNDTHLRYQDFLINGAFSDNFTPLILLAAVCGLFVHGYNLRTILCATVTLGGVFTAFFLLTASITVRAPFTEIAAILAMYPLRPGVVIDTPITYDGLFMTASIVFSFMALLIVLVSCGGRSRTRLIAGAIAVISLYCAVYTIAVYLPNEREQLPQTRILPLQESYYHED